MFKPFNQLFISVIHLYTCISVNHFLESVIHLFISVINLLSVNSGAVQAQTGEHKSEEKLNMERGNFLLHQAFDEDEAGNLSEAKELYTEAVEVFLKIVSFWLF